MPSELPGPDVAGRLQDDPAVDDQTVRVTTQDPPVNGDGRRARGAARRQSLMDAAFMLLARDGVGGLTHRSLAREADVSVAAVSYHFGTIDELLVAAMIRATEDWRMALASHPDRVGVQVLADHLAVEVRKHRSRTIAEYELYLLAARRPALREAATEWMDVALAPIGRELDPIGRSVAESVVLGICLQSLLADQPPTSVAIRATFERALGTGI